MPIPGSIVRQWFHYQLHTFPLPIPNQATVKPGIGLYLTIQRPGMSGCPPEIANHPYFQPDMSLWYQFMLQGPNQTGIWYPEQDHVHAEFGGSDIMRMFPNQGHGTGVSTNFIADWTGAYTFHVAFMVNADPNTRTEVQDFAFTMQLPGRLG